MVEPITDYIVTPHAASAMERRGISDTLVRRVLATPEQRLEIRPGRDVFQAKIEFGGEPYLVRVFIDSDRRPPEVVTVYRTSKITKYGRREP